MTNNYRVTGYKGVPPPLPNADFPGLSAALSVTATQPNTSVTLTLSSLATVLASVNGQAVSATTNGKLVLSLANAGDVAQIVSGNGKDFSGSLVQGDKPIQVISALPCINIPTGALLKPFRDAHEPDRGSILVDARRARVTPAPERARPR